ncbi:hypothetical protein F5Y17DRAFT_182289 [Xylariaceae sp. FL0594]|nr:hypothetical protein F5Y17DRAFT_182289 [Xylariaceae sp. FL0594]
MGFWVRRSGVELLRQLFLFSLYTLSSQRWGDTWLMMVDQYGLGFFNPHYIGTTSSDTMHCMFYIQSSRRPGVFQSAVNMQGAHLSHIYVAHYCERTEQPQHH